MMEEKKHRKYYTKKMKAAEAEKIEVGKRQSKRYAGFENFHRKKVEPEEVESLCIANCVCHLKKMCGTRVGMKCEWDLRNRFYKKNGYLD